MQRIRTVLILFAAAAVLAGAVHAGSICKRYPSSQVKGSGPLPYNYRVIDGHIHAGGHPLRPSNDFGNTDEQVLSILSYLKAQGVDAIIDLENTKKIQSRYETLLKASGIKRLHIPMNASKVPDEAQWEEMREAMKGKVYIHCKWGADRTGAVIAKYLVEEKGYSPEDAYKAVTTGGSHAGILGGLKTTDSYKTLVRFFWPNYQN